MIMEELMAVIVAAGIVPAKGVLTQLLQALRSSGVFVTQSFSDRSTKVATTEWVYGAMATVMSYFGFAISLAANGYIKFPSILGGWIVQWGLVPAIAVGASSASVIFPIAFPVSNFGVIGLPYGTSQGVLEVVSTNNSSVVFGEGSGIAGKPISGGRFISIGC
jgi:hypothetical protein